jgi:hypothetical protein
MGDLKAVPEVIPHFSLQFRSFLELKILFN